MAQSLEQFGATIKAKYPQYNDIPNKELGAKMLAKYPQYKDMVSSDVYSAPENRATKIGNLQMAAGKAQEESKKANSLGAYAGAVGGALASSEVGLGQSLQKIFGNQQGKFSQAEGALSSSLVSAAKKIREMEAQGKDTTKLKQLYNENARQLGQATMDLNQESALPSAGQVAGQLGGTALDLLSAGTYGAATQGMKAGQLAGRSTVLQKIGTVSPVLSQIGQVSAKTPGLFTKVGAGKVAIGGGIGYVSDVTQGLEGNRGENRTGAGAFIPGLGTAIGAGIPALAGAVQSGKNIGSKLGSPQNKLDFALELTQPPLTQSQKAEAIAKGRLKDPSLFGEGKLAPTTRENQVAESVQDLVKKQPVSKNVQAIQEKITQDNLGIRNMIADRKVPFNTKQLVTELQKGKEDLRLVFAGDKTAERTYSAVVDEFLKHLKGKDTLGLFDARQSFDQVPAIKKLLQNDKLGENVRKEIVLQVRKAANQYIANQLPKNSPYLAFMRKESLMLEALGNIGKNNANLIGKNQLQLLAERVPILKYVIGGALGAAGVGVGGAAINSL